MKAEELRIGNLITSIIPLQGSQIEKMRFKGDVLKVTKETFGMTDEFMKMLSGIPLTEEWLTKAGFKPWGKYDYLWKKGRNHACTIIQEEEFKGGKEWFELRGVKNGHVIIEYVHQLQNLYFALTGEELKFEL